jgi:hypothetical protein
MSNRTNVNLVFDEAIAEHLRVINLIHNQVPVLVAIADAMAATLRIGGKIL